MIQELKELVLNSKKIALISHLNPDGDAIGSQIAFYLALKKMGKNPYLINKTKEISPKYDFLEAFSKIRDTLPANCDLVISFDAGSFERLGIEKGDFKLINIDHHRSNKAYGDINIIEPDYASTGSIVYEIIDALGVKIDRSVAQALYLALAEDTNFFSDETTDERVFQLAYELVKLGASPLVVSQNLLQRDSLAKLRLDALFIDKISLKKDARVAIGYVDEEMLEKTGAHLHETAHLADLMLSLATVRVAIYYIFMPDGRVKFSLRGKGGIDISNIAIKYGGGGHPGSAGFTIERAHLEDVLENILNEVSV